MSFTSAVIPGVAPTTPYFYTQSKKIVRTIREIDDMATLMNVSDAIATRTSVAYEKWGSDTSPAVYAYVGDVYKGFFAETLSQDDIMWAQQHVMILSGLYGALRPLDYVSAYRLEMKAKLQINGAKNLYEFWGDSIARYVDQAADGIICVLSSDEYAKVATAHTSSRIVTPVFLDKKPNGKIGTVPIYSKMMRGVMARWIIDHRIDTPDALQSFSMYGYAFDAAHSTSDKPAFYRDVMTPLRFV
jgi:cytoplasmic iron level regulating protein YaaA (DUF328/UPF0246 family)